MYTVYGATNGAAVFTEAVKKTALKAKTKQYQVTIATANKNCSSVQVLKAKMESMGNRKKKQFEHSFCSVVSKITHNSLPDNTKHDYRSELMPLHPNTACSFLFSVLIWCLQRNRVVW